MAKCFIIIGRINKKLFLLLFAGLTQIIYYVIIIFCRKNKDYKFQNTFLYCLVVSISQILVRLYPLILKIPNEQNQNINLTTKKKILHYFFLCLIFVPKTFLGYIYDSAQKEDKEDDNQEQKKDEGDSSEKSSNLFPDNNPITLCLEMIFLICISTFCLKYKYFIHHIISLVVLIIIGVLFFCSDYKQFFGEHFKSYIIFIIPHAALDAAYRCYQKYLMEKFYYPYWNIALVPGIVLFPIALFLFLYGLLKANGIKTDKDFLVDFFVFRIVLPLVFNIIMCPLTIMIVFYFSPDYILIISLLAGIGETLIIVKENIIYLSFYIPSIIVQIFVMLIYLEILELNFCGLNKNTRRNIHLRGENEIDLSFDQRETVSEDNNADIAKKKYLELEEKFNKDFKNEEEQEEEKVTNT